MHLAVAAASLLQPWSRTRRGRRADQPPVSIILPVARPDWNTDTTLSSVFGQAYPRFEVLVSAQEETSPVLDIARNVARRFPQIDVRILGGNKQFTRNPKVSNLAPAIEAARYDLLLVKDSNITLHPDQLAELVQNLTAGVGLVCAVPIGIAPVGFAAEIERAILNGHFAPILFGLTLLQINAGFGKVMLFKREDFHRVGGVRAIGDTFGDDHALARALARVGLRTVYAQNVAFQALGRRSFREVCDRQLRWMLIRRFEEPLAYIAEPLASCTFAVATGIAAAPAFGWSPLLTALGTLAFWLAQESAVALVKGWSWSWKFPLAGLCREVVLLGLWVRSWFSHNVRWAGSELEAPRGIV